MSKQDDGDKVASDPGVVSRIFSPSIEIRHADDSTALKIPVAAAAVGAYFLPGFVGLGLLGGLAAKLVGKKIKIEV